LAVNEQLAVSELLSTNIGAIIGEWFDRFIIGGKLLTTLSYASNFKHMNSLVFMDNGQLGDVIYCYIKTGSCLIHCDCVKKVVLLYVAMK
jgi:hypothetical protein